MRIFKNKSQPKQLGTELQLVGREHKRNWKEACWWKLHAQAHHTPSTIVLPSTSFSGHQCRAVARAKLHWQVCLSSLAFLSLLGALPVTKVYFQVAVLLRYPQARNLCQTERTRNRICNAMYHAVAFWPAHRVTNASLKRFFVAFGITSAACALSRLYPVTHRYWHLKAKPKHKRLWADNQTTPYTKHSGKPASVEDVTTKWKGNFSRGSLACLGPWGVALKENLHRESTQAVS